MLVEIRNQKQLEKVIKIYGDYDPTFNFFSKQNVTYEKVDSYMLKKNARLFTIFGCTHISETERFINENTSVCISDDDFLAEKVEKSAEDGLEVNDINRPIFKSKIASRGKTINEMLADAERAAQFCK